MYTTTKSIYNAPHCRVRSVCTENNFVQTAGGEDSNPKPGTWSFFDELSWED